MWQNEIYNRNRIKDVKTLDMYAAYTLILSPEGGASDVIERGRKCGRDDKACSQVL